MIIIVLPFDLTMDFFSGLRFIFFKVTYHDVNLRLNRSYIFNSQVLLTLTDEKPIYSYIYYLEYFIIWNFVTV